MKNALFLFTAENYETRRLREEAKGKQLNLDVQYYQDLPLALDTMPRLLEMANGVDFCVSRVTTETSKFAQELRALLLENAPVFRKKFLNGETYHRYPAFSKLLQTFTLASHQLPTPRTWYHQRPDRFPFVLKGLHSSKGLAVHKVETMEEFEQWKQHYGEGNFLIQEMLPPGEDYRIVVLGKKILCTMKKISQSNTFVTNIAAGGKAVAVESERLEQLSELALKACQTFEIEFGGVDIMYGSDGRPYILEINRAPGFSGIEEFSKVNVAKALLDYMETK